MIPLDTRVDITNTENHLLTELVHHQNKEAIKDRRITKSQICHINILIDFP